MKLKYSFSLVAAILMSFAMIVSSCEDPTSPGNQGGNGGVSVNPTPEVPSVPEIPVDPSTPSEPEISPDSVLVSLGAHLDFTTESLYGGTKAGSNDLYALRVRQYTDIGEPYAEDYPGSAINTVIAYGTFDDLSTVVFKVAKRHIHAVELVYVPDGKNLVQEIEPGHYGLPFTPWGVPYDGLNALTYKHSEEGMLLFLMYGAVQKKGEYGDGTQDNLWSDVNTYYGCAFFDPEKTSAVNVELKSCMIGFRIEATDFEKGTIRLRTVGGHDYYATPGPDNKGVIDVVVEKQTLPSLDLYANYFKNKTPEENTAFREGFFYDYQNQGESVVLSYILDGEETQIFSKTIKTVAGNRYCMSFSLSDAIANGSVKASVAPEKEFTNVNLLDD